MEIGLVFDGAVIVLEPAAPRSNGAIKVVDGFEVLADERLIDKGPEALSGLEFRAAWRLIDEPDAVWTCYGEAGRYVGKRHAGMGL